MWELDHKEGWMPKNWCFWTVPLEKTLESPLDCKEIQPVNPKGNQSWIFIGRTDAETETSILWPPNAKSQLIGKDPDTGKVWGQEEKRVTEDEMVGWHHQLNGHEFEQTPGDGEEQGSLECCSPWGCRVRLSDWIELCAQSCLTLWPHELYPTRLLCPRDFPGKNTGVGCHFLLQGIFLTQGLNPSLLYLLHCRWFLYHWVTWEVPCFQNPN